MEKKISDIIILHIIILHLQYCKIKEIIMDRITKSLMAEFLATFELKSDGESKDFEKFANYIATSSEYNKTFDIDSITIGQGSDTAIDGISIIVNGQLIESTDEIDDLLGRNNFLEVDYLFIQAKTSSNFEGSQVSSFLFGISDFFSTEPKLVRNDDVQHLADISNYIIEKAPKFKRNPLLKIYYVTTGNWTNDANINAHINSGKETLSQTNLFSNITFNIWGAKELASAYRKTQDAISSTINFSNRITMPSINGISQAYIGLLPYSEFLKILSDSEGNLQNVFEDNVRDFQGDNNDVNGGIANTLNNDGSEIFSVLNNGVTIVASSISPTGDQFTLTDYQIVNGCQTSNVLFNNRDGGFIQNVFVPIKLIATTDDDVKTRITLATNNQTPIKKEQLAVLTQFQRSLEQYYKSFDGDSKLFYERRSKQYNSDNHIVKSKIITVQYQIKSFAAMFLNEPQNVTSFYGSIVKKLNEGKIQIFNQDHSLSPYYTSAFAYYKLETLFRKGSIDSSYKKVRFHILLLFRILNSESELPPLNSSKKMEAYCNHLLKILNKDSQIINAFNQCIKVIDESGFDKSDKQNIKLASKTKVLIEYADKMKRKN